MTYYFVEYFGLCIFLLVSFFLVCILFSLATLLSQKNVEIEKVVSYECGFERAVIFLFYFYIF